MPLAHLAGYGAGIQVHVEDLAAYIAGRERGDADTRWGELRPAYQDLAAHAGQRQSRQPGPADEQRLSVFSSDDSPRTVAGMDGKGSMDDRSRR